jgi:UDP-glucose 4-epimerase
MRALVTGAAGFIGSHLVERLVARGHDVVGLDDLSTGRRTNVAHLVDEGSLELVEGSALDAATVDRLVRRADAVFHLAAAVGVRRILDDPLGSLRTNLHGTETVLEAARRHGARVLVASTSEVYGKNAADGLREDSDRILGPPMVARWSYAQAKALDETFARLYWEIYGVPTVCVRLFNTAGPRQTGRYGMVVPRFIGQALRGAPLTVYGDGAQTRCFCYVGDVVDALVELIDAPDAAGEAVNLGRPEEVSIRSLAERVIALTGSASTIQVIPYAEAFDNGFEDMQRRVPDISLARKIIDFEPKVDLDGILRRVIEEKSSRAW